VHRLLDPDHYGEKIVGMQIFLAATFADIERRLKLIGLELRG
jgi:hypothetical protein